MSILQTLNRAALYWLNNVALPDDYEASEVVGLIEDIRINVLDNEPYIATVIYFKRAGDDALYYFPVELSLVEFLPDLEAVGLRDNPNYPVREDAK